MIEKSGLVQELLVLQQQYEGRHKELEKWKAEFDRLSQETEEFMFSFMKNMRKRRSMKNSPMN